MGRPNVLLILSDDQGAWALGAAGNTEIHTPNLDALARRGLRFENAFCSSPVCSPARASLLTGRIPSGHGVHDFLQGHEAGSDGIDYLEGFPLVVDSFHEAGYRTGLIGKWHLGASDRPRPGFDHWFALEGGSSSYYRAVIYRGSRRAETTQYLTDVFADDALSFLDGSVEQGQPFFLSLNFTAPHKPWAGQHPREATALYDDCAFSSCPQETPHPWLLQSRGVPVAAEPDIHAALVGYFAAVTAMDTAIGRVLERLEELGVRENTIVVFTSDNGFNCGQHGIWGKGNGTFPVNLYDSSVKVPLIVDHPGSARRGLAEELVSAYDLAATLLDLAGLPTAPFADGPGSSFAGAVRGAPTDTPRAAVVVFDEYGPARMIRTERWKYVHRYPFGPHELYDLTSDPLESLNLITVPDYANRVADLRRQMHEWFARHTEARFDGSALPVSGGGQTAPLADDPLAAFRPWDASRPTGRRAPSGAQKNQQ